jgi:hypothetical protein
MPRRTAKIISALRRATTPKKLTAKSRAAVRQVTQGTLLAMTLAAQIGTEAPPEKKRLFHAGLVDRLRAPLTRYHE